MRKCNVCKHVKPYNRFGFDGDSVCLVCRKLIKRGIVISSRAKVSKLLFHDNNNTPICVTCRKAKPLDDFPPNSYECQDCFEYRHIIEDHQLRSIQLFVKCLVCEEVKECSHFPSASFICKSCISKTNRLQRRWRYD